MGIWVGFQSGMGSVGRWLGRVGGSMGWVDGLGRWVIGGVLGSMPTAFIIYVVKVVNYSSFP